MRSMKEKIENWFSSSEEIQSVDFENII